MQKRMVKKMNEVCEYANQPTILPPRWCCVACHFPHWVWVYGVTLGTTEDKVYFTGNNFLPPLKVAYDEWPVADANGVSTHLPWRGGIHKDEKSGKFISTSEMVWKWKQYDPDGYDVNGFPYYSWDPPWFPIIFTRYYDGSP